MTIGNYFFDGGQVTAAMVRQGTVVPAKTKRKITGAIVCNNTATAKSFSAQITGATAATALVFIDVITIGAHESYICQELIGRGMNEGGFLEVAADVAGMNFKFEAIEFT